MSVLQSIIGDLLPTLVEKGYFGADKVRFVEFLYDDKMTAQDSSQSKTYFGDIVTETEKGDSSTQSIMIKTLPERLGESNSSLEWDFWLQFQNEFLFYSELLPLFNKCDSAGVVKTLFPKFFYGSTAHGGLPVDNILIFENVQKFGFRHNYSKAFIDYNHIKLSLDWLGKFHALSLICKKQFPRQLQDLCSKISEVTWTEERVVKKCDAYYVENGKRGILPLLEDPPYKGKLVDIIDAIQEADLFMAKMVMPVEPLAVICLGDFNRNNIFYKYDQSGQPTDTVFFDFGAFRYASPIIDLSFFLFMNSAPEVKSLYWDEMLRTYHASLISNPDIHFRDIPSLKDIALDFQRRGLYGYLHACHFLPVMLLEKDEEVNYWTLCTEDWIKLRVSTGGERATGYVVEIVKHMIDKNFDFKFIRNVATKFKDL